jgi:hypothetical protein
MEGPGVWKNIIFARRRGEGNIGIGGSSVCPSVLSPPIRLYEVLVGFVLLNLVAKESNYLEYFGKKSRRC